jgi:uncharacterized membrane protein YjfL (UPF0719 family)
MFEGAFGHALASVVYSLIGIAIFAVAFLLIEKIAPFSVRKELAEDDNVAVGVLMGAIVIGLSIIIAAAIGS